MHVSSFTMEDIHSLYTNRKSKWLIFLKIFKWLFLLAGALFIGLIIYFIIHPEPTEDTVLETISTISGSIGKISCLNSDQNNSTQYGTGILFSEDNQYFVETNAHVVLGEKNKFHACTVTFPPLTDGTPEATYETELKENFFETRKKVGEHIYNGIDYAILKLKVPDQDTNLHSRSDIKTITKKQCAENTNIQYGTKVYGIGYPDIGGESLTITEGIVGGFLGLDNEWIKISASTSHGSSGGLVLSSPAGCHYGILSSATFQQGSNLGFALSTPFIEKFIASPMEETEVYDLSKTSKQIETEYLTKTETIKDISIKYPSDWTLSTSTNTLNGGKYTEFYALSENALDSFNEFVSILTKENQTKDDLYKIIQDYTASFLATDANNKSGSYITKNGITVFFTPKVLDQTLTQYAVPVEGISFIFLYKNTIYDIFAATERDAQSKQFLNLINTMLETIKFN